MFKIYVVYMGQGDCAIIRCPDGEVIMIDCGSSRNLDERSFDTARNLLNSLLKGKPLYALILTHPDQDHYNKVSRMLLKPKTKIIKVTKAKKGAKKTKKGAKNTSKYIEVDDYIKIRNVYHSCQLSDYHVTRLSGMVKAGYFGNCKVKPVKVNSLNPIPETILQQRNWNIQILASNVINKDNSITESRNSASVVTLIDTGLNKALFTGDATTDTQDFLFQQQGHLIGNVNLYQLPHHGSDTNKSSDNFIKHVDPQRIYISVEFGNTGYALPRWEAIDPWIKGGTRLKNLPNHILDSWTDKDQGLWKRIPNLLKSWEHRKLKLHKGNRAVVLNNPVLASKDPDGIWGYKRDFFMIFILRRRKIGKHITATPEDANLPGGNLNKEILSYMKFELR